MVEQKNPNILTKLSLPFSCYIPSEAEESKQIFAITDLINHILYQCYIANPLWIYWFVLFPLGQS